MDDSSILRTDDGTTATIETVEGRERLCVRDAAGQLVFEYAHGTMRVVAPSGDLELSAPQGTVRISGRDGVDLRAGTETRAQLTNNSVSIQTPHTSLETERATVIAKRLTQTINTLATTVAVLETRAGRIVERAKNVYREVDELAQLKAGRIRNVAVKAFQVLSESLTMKAEKDAKIKGEKIYLA